GPGAAGRAVPLVGPGGGGPGAIYTARGRRWVPPPSCTGTAPAIASPPRLPDKRPSSLVAISIGAGVGVSSFLTVVSVLTELSIAWARILAGRQKLRQGAVGLETGERCGR